MTPVPAARPELHDIAAAFGLLTRLPVAVDGARAAARGAAGAWAYPLVGVVVGTLSAAAIFLSSSGVGAGPAAALGLITAAVVTGGLHEDGLSDTADGLWGGWTRARRLEIMKDSRIGVYGVLALVLSLLLRWSLLVALIEGGHVWAALVATGALSRVALVLVWAALPPARSRGLAADIGRPQPPTALLAGAVALPVLVLLPISASLAAVAAASAAALAVCAVARAKIGGQTGDILGAAQQMTECAVLLALGVTLT